MWVRHRVVNLNRASFFASSGQQPEPLTPDPALQHQQCDNEQGQVTPCDVKPGDRVLFGKWGGTEVKIDGEDLLIMKESDIMGIIG